MTKAIHLSQALTVLNKGDRVSLSVITANGRLMRCDDIISLSFDRYKGTRTVKFIRSGQLRTIHDVCIVGLNDLEVFL